MTATTTINLPGAFTDWFDGTGLAQGQDDSDPECKATRLAYQNGTTRRAGRGTTTRVTADRTTLTVLAEYAQHCINANADETVPAELRAAHTVLKRATEALATLPAEETPQEAEEAQEAPTEKRPAVDHSRCAHHWNDRTDLAAAQCEKDNPLPDVNPAALTAARILEGLTVHHRRRASVKVTGHGVRLDGTVTLTLTLPDGVDYHAPLTEAIVTDADRTEYAARLKAATSEDIHTLTYITVSGRTTKYLSRAKIDKVGALVARNADRGEAWSIAVRNADGNDVTTDFPCFQN
ncbi:hypothetical protein [Streptomyces albidoflavus]|uniref:hypothetical protein n=1 Tax=Streptomyces albidoflavus TaxID=1886 RepID=UPI0033CB5751